jgi:hypothetical protein
MKAMLFRKFLQWAKEETDCRPLGLLGLPPPPRIDEREVRKIMIDVITEDFETNGPIYRTFMKFMR